jgi:uncharacterized protein (TIGR00725 family)
MAMTVVGIMGPGEDATEKDKQLAYELGSLIAQEGWVLLTGGRAAGVMDAASRGAKSKGGLVVGILPASNTEGMSAAVDIPIVTAMHEARNNINVLSCRILFFIGMNPGTAAELALAGKARRPSILVAQNQHVIQFFSEICGDILKIAADAVAAIEIARQILRVSSSL